MVLTMIPISDGDTIAVAANPQVNYDHQQIAVADARIKVEKSKNLPDFRVGYNQQLLIGAFNPAGIDRSYFPGTRIGGIQFGVGIPLFSGTANRARVKSEQIESQIAQTNYQNTQTVVRVQYEQELAQYRKYKQVVNYYLGEGLKLADEQLRIAQVSFNLGEIGYIEYVTNISAAVQSKLNYLEVLSRLNQSAIQLQYLKGE